MLPHPPHQLGVLQRHLWIVSQTEGLLDDEVARPADRSHARLVAAVQGEVQE